MINFYGTVIIAQCATELDAGPDRNICPNVDHMTISLEASIDGPYSSPIWTPATGLDYPFTFSPNATIIEDIVYTLTVNPLNGDNLIEDGDFEDYKVDDQPTSFTSDYTFDRTMINISGHYAMVQNPPVNAPNFNLCEAFDHTFNMRNQGNLMVANGSADPNAMPSVWCQQVSGLTSNTEYVIQFWSISLDPQIANNGIVPSYQVMIINDPPAPARPDTIWSPERPGPDQPCVWGLNEFTWNTADFGPTFEICINMPSSFDGANPKNYIVGLDDIQMYETCTDQLTDFVVFTLDPLPFMAIDTFICPGEQLIYGGDIFNVPDVYDILLHEVDEECDTLVSLTITEFEGQAITYSFDDEITCFTQEIILEGDYDTNTFIDPADIIYQWTTTDGRIVGDPNAQIISVDSSGTYILHIKIDDPNFPCTFIDALPIVITDGRDTPPVSAGQDLLIGCGTTERQLNGTGSGTMPDYRALWSTTNGRIVSGESTLMPTIDMMGDYVLEILNQETGCTSYDTVHVDIDQLTPEVVLPDRLILDCGQNSAEIDASASTLLDRVNILWTTTDGSIVSDPSTLIIDINAAGTYILTLTDPINNCSDQKEITVTDGGSSPELDPQADQELTCATTQITLSSGYTGPITDIMFEWMTANGNIISGTTDESIEVNMPGTYDVLVTDRISGCSSNNEISVTSTVLIPVAEAGPNEIINCMENTVQLNGAGTSEGNDFTILWTTTNGNIVNGGNTIRPTVNSPGRYYIQSIHSASGCFSQDSTDVTASVDLPSVNITLPDTLNCLTNMVTLDASLSSNGPNFSIVWSTTNGQIISGQNTLIPQINQPGLYTLEITNTENNCTNDANVTVVSFTNQPIAVADNTGTLTCIKAQLMLDASSSTIFEDTNISWSTADGRILADANTLMPIIDMSGTYTLSLIDGQSRCQDNVNVVVVENITPPVANAGQPQIIDCSNTDAQLDGSDSDMGPNYTYSWTTTNGNILNGQNSLTPTVNTVGTYILEVTDLTNGCTALSDVRVTQSEDTPTADAGPEQSLTCVIPQVILDGSNSDNGPNIEYLWQTVDGNIVSGQTDLMPIINAPGTYNLTVTNTENNCRGVSSVRVMDNKDTPRLEVDPPNELSCTVMSVQLDGSKSEVGPMIAHMWRTSDGTIISGVNTTVATVNQIGTYTLIASNTETGCIDSIQVVVDQDDSLPKAMIVNSEDLTCTRTSVQLQGMGSATGALILLWTTTDGQITSNPTLSTIEINQPGSYLFTVTDTDSGCSSTAERTVTTDYNQPQISVGNNQQLFCGQEFINISGSVLQSSGSTSTNWSTIDGNIIGSSSTLEISVSLPGIYSFTATDLENGCTSTDDIFVELVDELSVDLAIIQPNCSQPAALVTTANGLGLPPYTYSLNSGTSFQSFPIKNLEPDMSFAILIQDANGCQKEDTIVTNPVGSVDVDIEEIELITLGQSIDLHAIVSRPFGDLDSIQWSPSTYLNADNILNVVSTPDENITYTIYVETYDQCIDSASIRVLVRTPKAYYVPNTFTPNRDNINDYWTIYGSNRVQSIAEISIFDRWGTLLFKRENIPPNDERMGWDGQINGRVLQPGVYVYHAVIALTNGELIPISGDITLLQ